jgi:hypothetical protein
MTGGSGRGATKLVVWLGAMIAFTGCAHIGPGSIPVDRFDYSTAVADSWKQVHRKFKLRFQVR